MTIEKKEKLKQHLLLMAKITKYVYECKLYSHDLHFPNTSEDMAKGKFIVSPDIYFFRYLTRNMVILELSKLFLAGKYDKLSFINLINKFSNSGEFNDEGLYTFSNNIYNKFKKDRATLINDIHNLRNKVIAHTDLECVETQNSIWDFLTNFNVFIVFAGNFISHIYEKAFGEKIPFDFDSDFYKKSNFEMLSALKMYKSNSR